MCGTLGIVGYRSITREAIDGTNAINRRGEETAGFCFYNTIEQCLEEPIKDEGLAYEVALKHEVHSIPRRAALCHVRYPTSGSTEQSDSVRDAQPLKHPDIELAVAHNGQIHNIISMAQRHGPENYKTSCDAEVLLLELGLQFMKRDYDKKRSEQDFFTEVVLPSVNEVYNYVHGGYAAIFMTKYGLLAFKDPNGVKPLSYGTREEGWKQRIHMFASETVAFHTLRGFKGTREIYGGQVMMVGFDGEVFSDRLRFDVQTPCGFEPAYIMDATSDWHGEKVYDIRERLGHIMASKWSDMRYKVDRIMAVPNSPIPAGHALAYDWHRIEGGIIPLNRGRSFLKKDNEARRKHARDKFEIVKSRVAGARIALVEDSVVRGNTMKELIQMLREMGASEVRVLSYWPPYTHCCPSGLDIVDPDELLANQHGCDERRMADFLKADSFNALTVEELVSQGLRRPISQLCVGCTTGKYPNDRGTIEEYFTSRKSHRRK